MSHAPQLRFISLFVPNLADATRRYAALLQTAPCATATLDATGDGPSMAVPLRHPFAANGPVVFQLGDLALALYECDGKVTHAGDVGFGLVSDDSQTAARLAEQGGTVFWGPTALGDGQNKLAVGMLPDRHFFEIVEPSTD
jgi:hypothetical protein